MIRIGISGWTYAPWRGIFYPAELPQRGELAYASRQLPSIEINGTFYSLQRPSSYGTWFGETPDDFVFSVKAPRYITHIRRLKEIAVPMANFFASGVLRLEQKLGPILWQLPPSLKYDRARLETFFSLLPRDTKAASALARRHDTKVSQTWLKGEHHQPLRHALEVRHPSFNTPEFVALLRQHQIALVVADTAGKWPFMEDVTADFIYVRLHGDAELYVSGYTDAALREWARKIRTWHEGKNPANTRLTAPTAPEQKRGRDVFVYFDNDVKTHAPYDAMTLGHLLDLRPKPAPLPAAAAMVPPPTVRTSWPGFPTAALLRGRKKPARRTARTGAVRKRRSPAPRRKRNPSRTLPRSSGP